MDATAADLMGGYETLIIFAGVALAGWFAAKLRRR